MQNNVPRIQHSGAGGCPPQAQYGSAKGTAWQGKPSQFSRELEGLGASLNCLYINTGSMSDKQDELETSMQFSLGSQRHGGTAHTTGVL